MVIIIDQNNGVPVYRQLIDQIRFHIAGGLISPGDELPSTRTLSEQLGVNPMTVSKAYSLLEQQGLVERRPGLPLIIRKRPARSGEINRDDQLRNMLEPAVAAVRQLGIPNKKAADVFRTMLEDTPVGRRTK
ncbi:MAG: GntR family transcriptional regulator [Gemmatimonadaceae bacterium]|nr:GntR family transcriptional regulator [Gemmatimonadaceae bacterium]